MYFEMDFTPGDDLECEDELDDSSSLCDPQDDSSISQDFRLPTIPGQVMRSSSSNIPIRYTSLKSPLTPKLSTPSSCCTPVKSESMTTSPPCLKSLIGTPSSSASPSSSFIPRILRESFSKLLSRSNKAKTPDKEQACSDSDCCNDERRSSAGSTISPATEEVVNESLRNGLPIIPFAYPTFFTVGRKQEDARKKMRKNPIRSMKRSFSEGKCLDYSKLFEEDEEPFNKFTNEDKSLDSIVRLAKKEIENRKQGDKTNQQRPRKESQSSYVEMNPEDMLSGADDPYMSMESIQENDYLHMEKRKKSADRMFQLEDCNRSHQNLLTSKPFDFLGNKFPTRKNNLFQVGKAKSELHIEESIGRRLKKGNKHKDDYVFFDFEKNKDYVEMGKAKTNKWHFLDFRNNK